MSKFSIDRSKGKISDIKHNIEIKKNELSKLQENKKALLDAGTDIQASDIDENVQRILMEKINSSLEENAEKGEELSNEMNSDFDSIETMKLETDESIKSNQKEKVKLEQKKALLERFGLGSYLENGISELEDNYTNLENLNENLIETEKELSEVSQKLSTL